jgi:hypothetical protein
MKIRLTERQYSKLIKEATWIKGGYKKMDSLVDSFIKELDPTFDDIEELMEHFFNLFFNIYMFTLDDVRNNKKLYDILFFYSKNLQKTSTKELVELPNSYYIDEIFQYIMANEYTKILKMKTPEQRFNNLNMLYDRFVKHYGKTKMLMVIDDHSEKEIDDVINHIINTYDPVEAIKRLSVVNTKIYVGSKIHDIAKEIADKNGITLIGKSKGYTLQRKENSMARDLIDYMKDIVTIKKTKRGFLDYIGSHYSGGQYSDFWSAVNHAGIIEKVGGGNNVTYKLGPNYDDWEEDKVVAF